RKRPGNRGPARRGGEYGCFQHTARRALIDALKVEPVVPNTLAKRMRLLPSNSFPTGVASLNQNSCAFGESVAIVFRRSRSTYSLWPFVIRQAKLIKRDLLL